MSNLMRFAQLFAPNRWDCIKCSCTKFTLLSQWVQEQKNISPEITNKEIAERLKDDLAVCLAAGQALWSTYWEPR